MIEYEHQEDISVKTGERRQYQDKLYKCRQEHTTQADWIPDVTVSLWTVIDESHTGTLDDPIPVAAVPMEYIKGNYYIENKILYLMNRDGMEDGEAITVDHFPSQLIGHYFEVVTIQ